MIDEAAEPLRSQLEAALRAHAWGECLTYIHSAIVELDRLTAEQPPVVSPATVEELERILNSESDEEIEIWSDGSVHPKGHKQPPVPSDREKLAKLMDVEADRAQALVMVDGAASEIATMKRQIAAALRSPADGWRTIGRDASIAELQAEIGRLQSILHYRVLGDPRVGVSSPTEEKK